MKKFNFRIRPTVLALFIFVISSVIIVTLSLQYYFLQNLALKATNDNLKHVSQKIEQRINNLDKENNDLISSLEINKSILEIPQEYIQHPLLKQITNHLENHKHIYAIYMGNKNGDFYEVINLSTHTTLREKYKTTPAMKWLVVKIYNENGKRVQYHKFLDRNHNLVRTNKTEANYNPSKRPWFKQAFQTNNFIKTDPYTYANLEGKGITYAKRVPYTNSVLGIDVSLESMSGFLKEQLDNEQSEIYLFHKDKITSSATYKEFYKSINFENIKASLENSISSFKIKNIDNEEYYCYYSKVSSLYAKEEYLFIYLPLSMILDPYKEKIYYSFYVTLAILLFTIPLIWFSTKLLATPILRLEKENNKVINRDFDNVKFVESHIAEINTLSNTLKKVANSFQKYEKDQRELMDSFIKIIASAIDAKSKYTGGHCERVPVLSMMITKEASKDETVFKDFKIKNKEEERELNIAAWLHDCGKVTTPEYVVDKATKLETIYNRIHEIRTRFEVIYRDLEIQALKNILAGANKEEEYKKVDEQRQELHKEFELIAKSNIGGEFMDDEDIEEVEKIAKRTWIRYFDNTLGISRDERNRLENNKNNTTPKEETLLSDRIEHIFKREEFIEDMDEKYGFKQEAPEHLYNLGEIYNLKIRRGTLTEEERYKINEHMKMSIIMLEELPFQENLRRVPEYAGAHHETLIGTGYPRKLTKEQMSLPARILALADVFEALTSSDRPYKEAKTLSESIKILSFMVKDQHLDKDIFELFLRTGIYKKYANDYLEESQIDEVDINKFLS